MKKEQITMETMTARQRFINTMTFKKVDRCFLKEDGFMPKTLKRWEMEGLPQGVNPNEYFNVDMREFCRVNMECIPAFDEKILEENESWIIKIDQGGRTVKILKGADGEGMPQFLDWPIRSRADFDDIKARFQPQINERYPADYNAKLNFWNNTCTKPVAYEFRGMFFHRLHMWLGLEGLCMAMFDDPSWVHEMVAFLEDFLVAVSEKVFSEVKLDYVYACDDIAYKTSSLISPAQFREFFFEPTKRVIQKVCDAGIPVIVMDTDGNLDEFAQIYLDAGFNTLCPVEVAAGNDLLRLRKRFGKKLAFQGGVDKRLLAGSKEEIRAEITRLFPSLMAEGGFSPTVDHDVPEEISFENYRYYMELAREIAENPERFM